MAGTPPESGCLLPESLKFVSRIPVQATREVNGISVTLGPWHGPALPLDNIGAPSELAALTFLTNAESPENALASAYGLMESVLDDLSFQLQRAVDIVQLEILDVTPPISVGMVREMLLYPFPLGFHSPKFLQSIAMGNVETVLNPTLRSDYGFEGRKTSAALRWYVKALAAPFDVEKFVFNWIAIEILCSESDIVVEKPYLARCGHEISNCPVCSAPTSRVVNGLTIKSFLIEKIGINDETADELWKMRQMFHGANPLTQSAIKELPRLVLVAQHAALQALKQMFGMNSNEFPISSPEGASIHSPALGGTCQINDYDLNY